MKWYVRIFLATLLVAAGVSILPAQGPAAMPPPKVMVIQREFLKPGKGGATHEKSESAFVRAMTAAKWPTYYIGMDSLSGPARSLFFIGFPSFSAWEKDNEAIAKNPTLSPAIGRAIAGDGELLSSWEQSVFLLRDDLSYGDPVDVATMRFFEITQFKVKPGHDAEWDELVKIYKDGYAKAVPESHWAVYASQYGAENGGLFLVIIPMKSLSDVDKSFGDDHKFMTAVGDAGMKRLAEINAAIIQSTQTNIFQINPKLSYMSDQFKASDPGFWKPKPAPAAAKKTE